MHHCTDLKTIRPFLVAGMTLIRFCLTLPLCTVLTTEICNLTHTQLDLVACVLCYSAHLNMSTRIAHIYRIQVLKWEFIIH